MSLQKFTFFAVGFMILCVVVSTLRDITSQPTQAGAAPELDRNRSTHTVTSTPSPVITSTQTPNVEITMLFLGATDTALAIAKTEVELHAQHETQAAKDLAVAYGLTSQAQQTADAAAQQAWIDATRTQSASIAANATATMAATQTQYAGTAWADVTATQLAATQEIQRNALLAKQVSIWGGVLIVFLVLLLGVAWLGVHVWRAAKIAKAEYIQTSAIAPDAQGRFPLPNMDALGKDNKIINPNLAHRAVTDPKKDDLTPDQALANIQSLRALEATRAITQSPALMRQMLRKPAVTMETPLPEANVPISKPSAGLLPDQRITRPSWSLLESWDGRGAVPYGVSARGLERVDLNQNFNVGVFGKIGQGKSRYFLRPFIATLLASGHRVIILGKSGDFWPFTSHPNVRMITLRDLTEPREAQRYADFLHLMVKEKNRRDEYLTTHRVSTWEHAGREMTWLVLDELGNALDDMQANIREEAYRRVNSLVKEGRKVGFDIILASQRAVGFKSIVEQMGRVAFHLSDADASRHAIGIPGAEQLPEGEGHFLAKFGRINYCVSFTPTDDELTRFLQSRPVQQLEPIDWIEGEATDIQTGPVTPVQSAVDPEEEQIRTILLRMIQEDRVSLRQVEQEVWGRVRGGQYFSKVQTIWKQIKAPGTTTTSPNTPESGAIAA